MKKKMSLPSYKCHRFPPEIIAHAVWRYFRFARSYRDVEELLAERGVILTHGTVRQWCREFGHPRCPDANVGVLSGRARRPHPVPGALRHDDSRGT